MSYSQKTAFVALTRAALLSIIKSPSSVVFSLAFPLIFIVVFGLIGDGNGRVIPIGFASGTDTTSTIYNSVSSSSIFAIRPVIDAPSESLSRGAIAALLQIDGQRVIIQTTEDASTEVEILKNHLLVNNNPQRDAATNGMKISTIMKESTPYKKIDFILPGQLGFSLLAASVFGTAFVFFSLRNTLVLKRFFATPIDKMYILLAEGTARMLFQIVGAGIIIFIGWLFFDFTLIRGAITVIQMLLLSALGLMIFMSFGFAISGIARSESTIPPLANMFTLPQFLLAGTFFPIDEFPTWLRWISQLMPLTHLNEALRAIAFDGSNLWDVRWYIMALVLWGVIGYVLAARWFKWEP